MRRQALIFGLVLSGAASAHAAPQPLSDDALKAAVSGKTVRIDTPIGLPITVNYGANGLMSGSVGSALAAYLGSDKDRGRWQIRDGKLCQKWFKWLDSDTTCLSIQQDGQKIFWRSDEGKTGTAMIEPGPPELSGAVASGLGGRRLPAQAAALAQPEPEPARSADTPEPPVGTKPHPGREREAVASAVKPASSPSTGPAKAWATVASAAKLVEPPTEVRHVTRVAKAVATNADGRAAGLTPPPIMASLGGSLPTLTFPNFRAGLAAAATEAHDAIASDPFLAEALPMRPVIEQTAAAAVAHRWCLHNAFAKVPLPATALPNDESWTADISYGPSLLAVTQEAAYAGELPLHEPSCLTAEPAIGVMARLTDGLR